MVKTKRILAETLSRVEILEVVFGIKVETVDRDPEYAGWGRHGKPRMTHESSDGWRMDGGPATPAATVVVAWMEGDVLKVSHVVENLFERITLDHPSGVSIQVNPLDLVKYGFTWCESYRAEAQQRLDLAYLSDLIAELDGLDRATSGRISKAGDMVYEPSPSDILFALRRLEYNYRPVVEQVATMERLVESMTLVEIREWEPPVNPGS